MNKSVVFFHDTRLKYDESGRYYTTSGLTSSFFDTYLELFNKLIVFTRKELIESKFDKSKFSLASNKNVTFECTDKLSVIKLFITKDRYRIRKLIKDSDFTIIRLPSVIGIAACIEAKKLKKPYVVEMVGCPWDTLWNYGKFKYKIAAIPLYCIYKYLVYCSPNVAYVSQEFLQKRYPTKGKSIACSDVQLSDLDETNLVERIEKIKQHKKSNSISLCTVAEIQRSGIGSKGIIRIK